MWPTLPNLDSISFRVPLAAPLGQRTVAMIDTIRAAPDAQETVKALTALVYDLTVMTTEYAFVQPLKEVRAGVVAVKLAEMGISTGHKAIKMAVGRILSGLDREQMLRIADFMESLLIR